MSGAMSVRTRVIAVVGSVLAVGLWAIANLGAWEGADAQAVAANLPNVVTVGFAVGASLYCATRFAASEPVRKQWLFIALGTGAFFIGDVMWAFYDIALGQEAPFPGLPDAAYLAMYPLLGVAMFSAVASFRQLFDMRSSLTIAALVAVGATAGLYFGVGRAIIADTEMTSLQTALSLLYPLADVWLLLFPVLALLITAVKMRAGSLVRPWWLVVVAVLLIFSADVLFTVATWNGTYGGANIIDLGWTLGFTLLAVAASVAVDVLVVPTSKQVS